MERLVCLAVGYVCGLLQTGYLIGEMSHVDIRKKGSGNAGTTNWGRANAFFTVLPYWGEFYESNADGSEKDLRRDVNFVNY